MNENDLLTIKIANLYLKGNSMRKIAEMIGLSHIAVHRHLTVKLPLLDTKLSNEVELMIKENSPKTIRSKEVQKRVLRSYFALVNDDKTIAQIAKDENETEFVIYRDLTRRLNMIHNIAPDIITAQMLNNVHEKLNSHSMKNLELGSFASVEGQKRENGKFSN